MRKKATKAKDPAVEVRNIMVVADSAAVADEQGWPIIMQLMDKADIVAADTLRDAIEPKTGGTFWRKKTRERVRKIIEAP